MKQKFAIKKILSGLIGTAMLCTSVPVVYAADDTNVIYSSDFEDGDVSAFVNRGENDTTVLSASDENAVSGSKSLCASGRSTTWNGPAFQLDAEGRCKPNTEYYVTAQVMGQYYTSVTLSMQYTDADGGVHYSNLKSYNGNGWQTVEDIKISYTSDMTDVFIYFEGGTDNIYIDDFTIETAPVIPIQQDIPSLSDVYADAFDIGTAIMASNLSSPSFMDLCQKHFSKSMTFGNELKPESVLNQKETLAYVEETGDDTNPQISLSSAKSLLEYCAENNIPVRGHTLVWHSQTPDWFFKEGFAADGEWVSKEKMLQRMENYIKNLMEALATEYPDVNIYAWDVVNEAWTDEGKPRNPGEQGAGGSNNSAWVQVFGDNSFIEPAFEYARKYAPEGCKLYYNDYNEYMPQKTAAIVEMANSLKEKGLIDGIGLQSHLDVGFPSVSVYKKALASFAETGLDIQVTELDITTSDTSETGLKTQAQMYSDIFDALLEYKDSISTVVLWGITDDQSWRASRLPLLFDAEFQAKPAFYSIIDGMDIPVTEPTDETTEPTGETTEPTSETTESTEETTESTEGSTSEAALMGDANCDGEVSIADAVAVAANIVNAEKNPLTAQGKANADVHMTGNDLNASDAFAIQQFATGVISDWNNA